MRTMEFKMERTGLVEIEQEVSITEGKVGSNYYYTIVPAVAMSGNFRYNERLSSRNGIIKSINNTPRGYYVVVEFDE